MKILITGATGFIGTKLTLALLEQGHEIHVLGRDQERARKHFNDHPKVFTFEWSNNLELPPKEALEGVQGIINLMGENIGAKRWGHLQKKILRQSRVDATLNLIKLIESELKGPLEFFLQASAIGIYPVDLKKTLDEDSYLGRGFLALLCQDWEASAKTLKKTKRLFIVRTGMVLEKDGGALKKMLPPFLKGLGGPLGDGGQIWSWIHRDDLVNLYVRAANDPAFSGIINGTSHAPVSNFDFTKALGRAIHRPTLIPVPALLIRAALGEMSTIVLSSQAVVSKRMKELGFDLMYPTVDSAMAAIFNKGHED